MSSYLSPYHGGRVWLEAATLAHTELAVPLSRIHWELEKKQPPGAPASELSPQSSVDSAQSHDF